MFTMPSKLLFLPGAMGAPQFWSPVATRLSHPAAKACLGWPGFGATPPDPDINGIDDLVTMVVSNIDQPTVLIAQSMGGIIAIRAALEKRDLVTHLVLAATSGGIDMSSHATHDWRPTFREENPLLPPWFCLYQEDLEAELHKLHMPTLLLWGDADPISPVSVGKHLASLLPWTELRVIPGGDHGFASTRADEIAPLIDKHLATSR
ncbi:MAG TPA: alpha/beta hydrolase [Noviherbaspirillum sp.]